MESQGARDTVEGIFGIDGETLASAIRTAAQSESIIATVAGVINAAALLAAVVILMYHLVSAILQSGEHGKIGGGVSVFWGPLRTALLMMLLVPLGSGYSIVQAGVIWLGMSGSALADNAWDKSNEYLLSRMQLALALPPRHLQHVVGPLAQLEACALGVEAAARGDGTAATISSVGVDRPSTFTAADTDAEAVRQLRYHGTDDLNVEDICGVITLRRTLAPGDDLASEAANAVALRSLDVQQRDLLDVRDAVRTLLEERHAGQLDAMTFRSEMLALEARFLDRQARQAQILNRELEPLEVNLREAQLAHARAEGWMFAGSFYMSMSSYDARLNAAAFTKPEFSLPRTAELPYSLQFDVTPYLAAAAALTPPGSLGDAGPNPVLSAEAEKEARIAAARAQVDDMLPGGLLGWAIKAAARDELEAIAKIQNQLSDVGNEALQAFREAVRGDGRGFVPRAVTIGHRMMEGGGALLFGSTIGGLSSIVFLVPLVLVFWIPGALLAYVLPAMPLLVWIAGVAGWLMMLIQALVAAPLWAAAHADPRGEGFASQQSSRGYMLLISLIARPVLMVAGFVAAMLVLEFMSGFILQAFQLWYTNLDGKGAGVGITGALVTILLSTAMLIVVTRWSFSLILLVPDSVLRFIGSAAENFGETQLAEQARTMALGYLASAATAGKLSGGIRQIAALAGKGSLSAK